MISENDIRKQLESVREWADQKIAAASEPPGCAVSRALSALLGQQKESWPAHCKAPQPRTQILTVFRPSLANG
jgi:hypothetical protein